MKKKTNDYLDQMAQELANKYRNPEDIIGKKSIIHELQRRFLQAALDGELTDHLGYKKHERSLEVSDNVRNGYSGKSLKTSSGSIDIAVPRDRNSSFEPKIIEKNKTRFSELDDRIIGLYSRGLSTKDIQDELKEAYSVDASSSFISTVTESVLEDVMAWQHRPLEALYPIMYLDCIVIKVKQDKRIINKSVYLALGVNTDGNKELLGMWISQNEGAKFWLSVLTELKNRGLQDVLIVCIDGLTGFPEAIEVVYPKAKIQLCIVHMIRNSMKYVSWKDRKQMAIDLKDIYKAETEEIAKNALTSFAEKWDDKYPMISKSWDTKWDYLNSFFDYPADIRKAIYTTNAIESLNMTLRKVIKNKRSFPSDDAAFKLLYLAIHRISKRWTMPIRNWPAAMNRFRIEFGDRVSV